MFDSIVVPPLNLILHEKPQIRFAVDKFDMMIDKLGTILIRLKRVNYVGPT